MGSGASRRLAGLVALAALVGLIVYARARREDVIDERASVRAEERSAEPSNAPPELRVPASLASSDPTPSPQREVVTNAESGDTRSMATLWVTVVSSETGTPLAGVRLSASLVEEPSKLGIAVGALDGELRKEPITGADGRARFRLKARRYYVNASWGEHRQSYRSTPIEPLASGERRELRLELPTVNDLHFCGRVVAAESGAPVSGAEFVLCDRSPSPEASRAAGPEGFVLRRGRTSASGRFEFDAASWESSVVRVSAAGRIADWWPVDEEHVTLASEAVLPLPLSAALAASVLTEQRPEASVTIVLFSRGAELARAETAVPGSCRFDELPAGARVEARLVREKPQGSGSPEHWCDPWAMSELLDSFELTPGRTAERTWALAPLCTVRGVAHAPDGSPLGPLELRWNRDQRADSSFYIADDECDRKVTTDENGAFVVERVPSGRWWIGPAPGSVYEAAAIATPVTISAGQVQAFVDLEVFCGLDIRGVVLGPDGEPVSGASVHAGVSSHAVKTDGSGAFRFAPVAPGDLELRAWKSGYPVSTHVVARAGDEGVVLRLERGGTLRLRFVDAAGEPVLPLWLLCSRDDPSTTSARYGTSGAIFDALAPGSYSLIALYDHRLGWLRDLRIEREVVSERTLVVDERAAIVLVRVGEADPLPHRGTIEAWRDGAMVALKAIVSGGTDLGVPPGECEIVLREDDREGEQRRVVTAVAGEELEVVFGER